MFNKPNMFKDHRGNLLLFRKKEQEEHTRCDFVPPPGGCLEKISETGSVFPLQIILSKARI